MTSSQLLMTSSAQDTGIRLHVIRIRTWTHAVAEIAKDFNEAAWNAPQERVNISERNRDRNHRMQTLTHVTGFTHTHTQIQAASGHSQESKKPTTETKPSNDVNTHTQWQCLETFKIFAKSNRHVYHCIFPAFLLSTNPASAFTPSFLLFSITHLHFHFSIWL